MSTDVLIGIGVAVGLLVLLGLVVGVTLLLGLVSPGCSGGWSIAASGWSRAAVLPHHAASRRGRCTHGLR